MPHAPGSGKPSGTAPARGFSVERNGSGYIDDSLVPFDRIRADFQIFVVRTLAALASVPDQIERVERQSVNPRRIRCRRRPLAKGGKRCVNAV